MATSLIMQNNLISELIIPTCPLTISYLSSKSANIQGANQVQLLVSFVKGSSDGCRLMLEYSEDQGTWYQESIISEFPTVSDARHSLITRVLQDTGNYVISVPVSASYFRVRAQAISSGEETSLSILVTKANI